MKEKIVNRLVSVKSIVTITLTLMFAVLSFVGKLDGDRDPYHGRGLHGQPARGPQQREHRPSRGSRSEDRRADPGRRGRGA